MTAEQALSLSARFAAVSILLSSLEYSINIRVLRDDGLMSWPVGRLRGPAFSVGWRGALFDVLLRYPNVLVLLALRVILSAAIVAGPARWTLAPLILLGLYAVTFLVNVRSRYGHDGADQLAGFLMLGIGVSSLVPTSLSRAACLFFFAFQSCLAYGTAGWCKLPMRGWRDGTYLAAVLTARIYGMPPLGRFLSAHPVYAKLASRGLLAWECSFPLVLILPAPIAFGMVGLGVVFHLVNACVMGLNCFVWSFVATYPPLLWTVQQRG
jgi:hypothetical protein